MIVVNLTGQLGNQMFQYALGRKLQLIGRRVKYYMGYYEEHPEHYFGLKRFPIDIPKASLENVHILCDVRRSYLNRLRRKIFGRHPHVISEINSTIQEYRQDVFYVEKAFIDGYWQTEKYFIDIRDVLIEDFTFSKSNNPLNTAITEEMQNCESVSIHVRRGDYLGAFPVMSVNYYNQAIRYFNEKYDNVHFFIFSNDFEWCYQNFKSENMTFVDWNKGNDSLFDMSLMTKCKHNIIANSSFSWWGAWLNCYKFKEVIAPNVWFFNTKTPDIYCDNWIIIPI